MISKKLRQVMAASMAVVMTVGLAACGNKPAADPTPAPTKAPDPTKAPEATATPTQDPNYSPEGYFIRRDDAGKIVDLGGMEVIIRDWWTDGDKWPGEPTNNYMVAQQEYWAWCEETYNFKFKRMTISDWGSAPSDFVDYCTTGGDDKNYVFTLRSDKSILEAMKSGLVYDLASLKGAIDFTDAEKWGKTKVHELYTIKGKTYAMAPGDTEARGIMFFNKRLLTEAGIDWQELYKKQTDPSYWNWDTFKDLLAKCTKDKDGDGVNDTFGIACNWGVMYGGLVYSNGGSWIKKDSNGLLVNNLESKETLEALQFGYEIQQAYGYQQPADGTWEYYKDAFANGMYAFMPDEAYYANNLKQGCKDEWGALSYPVGPGANGKSIMYVSDNLYCIPGCYDADRAWKIAFAYSVINDEIPGFEDYAGWKAQYEANYDDPDAIDNSIRLAMENGAVQYNQLLGIDPGPDLGWYNFSEQTPAQVAESIREKWQTVLDEWNK